MMRVLVFLCLALGSARLEAQDTPPAATQQPVLRELHLQGATVYKSDDVLWLLRLREGAPLPRDPAQIAKSLQDRYERDGYTRATVSAEFDAGRLTLDVDEGRIDEIEIRGVPESEVSRYRRLLGIKPGDIYNSRVIGRATARLTTRSGGALLIGRPRRHQPGVVRGDTVVDDVTLERRGARNVLVIPLRWQYADTDASLGSGREDLYSPVDGFSPALGISTTIFDHGRFNHTYLNGYVSYKFGRENAGYSFGAERPFFGGPRIFVGGEVHDVTASDDRWWITSFEQTLVSVAFKNSFRDYYRRRGAQLFTVFRTDDRNEFSAMARWDEHEPLPNATSYSFFRDDALLRPPLAVADQHVNAVVLGYTFDTRRLTGPGESATYIRHLKDDLFGVRASQRPGIRIEWTSEIAGHGLGGDTEFARHIVNLRGHIPISSRTLLSLRGLFGAANGDVPIERVFSIGGIGSVHGYAFKEASGTRLSLFNAECKIDLESRATHGERDAANVFVFYDAGRVSGDTTPSRWLNGTGFGIGAGGVRLEFGFRANAIPRSRQILLRFSPTF